jgi:hypothetical protein
LLIVLLLACVPAAADEIQHSPHFSSDPRRAFPSAAKPRENQPARAAAVVHAGSGLEYEATLLLSKVWVRAFLLRKPHLKRMGKKFHPLLRRHRLRLGLVFFFQVFIDEAPHLAEA